MVPRALMLATKIRAGVMLLSLLAVAVILVACAPPGPRALVRGQKLIEAGNFAAAVAELQTATTLLPTNAAAWNYLGVAYQRSGQWTNAVQAYSQALLFDRDLMEVRFNLGCLWLEQERWDNARSEFTAYTLRRPNEAEGWLKLGSVQLRTRDAAAEKSFREALRVEANNVEAWNGLGMYFAQRNRGREAADTFAAALKRQPNYAPALLNLATVLQQQLNDRSGALQRYREYLALQPRPADWASVNALVQALTPPAVVPPPATVKPTPVTTSSVATVSNSRPAPSAANSLAPAQPVVSIPVRSNPPSAAPVIRTTPPPVTAPRPAPTTPPVVATKPTAEPAPKPVSKPEPEPIRAAPIVSAPKVAPVVQPTNPIVVLPGAVDDLANRKAAQQALARGQQAQRGKKYAEAIQFYRRAVLLDKDYFEAHYLLGLAGFQTRNFQLALSSWEAALALRPDSADARYNYALALKADNRFQASADELEKLLALHPDEARGHLTLGNLYADQLRDIPRARRHYQRVLQLDPRNPQAQTIRFWLVSNPAS
jgi:tetratricopeptide (TPR) repeat protein